MNKELFQQTSTSTSTSTPTSTPTSIPAQVAVENDYTWEVNPDDPETVMILSFIGEVPKRNAPDGSLLPTSSLNIPYMLDNKITTIIGPGAFQGNTTFDRIVFHPDILSIEEGAFADCTQLKYISFNSDSKLQYIKEDAFSNTFISNPIIPASVLQIDSGAFNTQQLISVTFQGNCPKITVDSFNSRNNNGNLNGKISILYFNDTIGFENVIDDNKFLYVGNYRMRLPKIVVPSEPPSPSIYRYINYVLLSGLFLFILYIIYIKLIKKKKNRKC
jgi:hypothetical protein